MPAFNLAPKPEDLDPQWENKAPQSMGDGTQKPTVGQARATYAKRSEAAAGPLKPVVQFANALASPDTKIGIFTGPVNGISKLGNALGDLVQGKPIDVKDAWTISDQQARAINPWRVGIGQEVTPSDEAGLAIGEGIGAELAGAATGATLLQQAAKIRRVQQVAQALQQQAAVRRAAVAITASPKLKAATNVATNVGQAVGSAALAAPFLDQADGNLANLGDAVGLKLPGRVEPNENYLQSLAKSVAVEGIAAPLALLGMGALIKPIREGMTKGGPGWIEELANAELEPYLPRQMAGPALPPAGQTGLPQLPGYQQQGGALVPYDSAITRSLQEQTQIRQVTEQRQRLQDMGLVQQGEGGQLDLALGGAVDPEIKLQVQQLQTQRGQLIKQGMESGQDMSQDLAKIDQEIGDLIQAGRAMDPMDARPPVQPELDLPDGRPELDSYLAHLDEMSDADLRQIHSRVYAEINAERNAQELTAVQQRVDGLQGKLQEIEARAAAGEVTPIGAKRMASKVQKELATAQQQLEAIQGRGRVTEALVGDQLQLRIDQQDAATVQVPEEVQMPPFESVTRSGSEYGYQTPDDYRGALEGWNRDHLRRLAMPDSSPEVAALVKARTGRRVWQAKKSDIIDALVEMAERRGRFLPPEPAQVVQNALELTVDDAPWKKWEPVLRFLFEDKAKALTQKPADLSAPGMTKVLDADGVEQLVPATDYSGRGMDAQTRERLKAEILQRAIDNGEVQPPITPLPQRPVTAFEQSSLVDDLFADPTGQLPLAFSTDALPTYKAGGKNADALIEEMRLRFEYNVLDEQAQRAQQQALMAAHGWDTLGWEEKKKLGILGEGFYSLQPFSERFRDPTPQFNPELEAVPPRKPKQYGMEGGELVEKTPEVKTTPAEAAAAKKEQAAAARMTKADAKQGVAVVDKQIQAIEKRLEELTRQSQGAKC
jgi:hypothetical protein